MSALIDGVLFSVTFAQIRNVSSSNTTKYEFKDIVRLNALKNIVNLKILLILKRYNFFNSRAFQNLNVFL